MDQSQTPENSSYLNTVASVAIAPSGQGEELSTYVAQAIEVIRDSGLPNETNAMSTVIEGDLGQVMQTVEKATRVLAEQGYRTGVTLKLDIRQGKRDQIHRKVELIDEILSDREV
ncbi:MTH1187 family thiamine-binding protein [Bifidobacterium sp. W8108]|uniref:MTH1187 family thiamine-binding protein n=1 Tax=unclassified Bifidobacterium TaxID=2608897 RepID=UPI0018DC3CD0|nr:MULTISPECIES: MTH1187 family thiamine-binding protein [unclassified Bifidobacterium]MBH9979088.1 MTH1187 family thiamine-binding protein [Bifidobacterium sp. W8108]MBI0173040.1 MTH1187 family thiamine-binding protein [Bifidobacterium sp. M0307]